MANGFRLISRTRTIGSVLRQHIGAASTQFAKGDALTMSGGILIRSTAALKVHGILNAMITPSSVARPATELLTTTAGELLQYVPCMGGDLIFETDMTGGDVPTINGTAVNSGSTTTALVTAAGSTDDYTGGTIYFPETDTTHRITADSVSGGVHTFTFVPLAPRAIASTDTARVVPFGAGSSTAVKLSASTASLGVSTAIADKTGGQVKIEAIDLKNYKLRVSFPAVS